MNKQKPGSIDGIVAGLCIVLIAIVALVVLSQGNQNSKPAGGSSPLNVIEQASGNGPSTDAGNALQPNVGNTGSCGTNSIQSATCVSAQDVK